MMVDHLRAVWAALSRPGVGHTAQESGRFPDRPSAASLLPAGDSPPPRPVVEWVCGGFDPGDRGFGLSPAQPRWWPSAGGLAACQPCRRDSGEPAIEPKWGNGPAMPSENQRPVGEWTQQRMSRGRGCEPARTLSRELGVWVWHSPPRGESKRPGPHARVSGTGQGAAEAAAGAF